MLACVAGEGGILGRVTSTDEVVNAWARNATRGQLQFERPDRAQS
jgi:hypothetical protein